MLKRKRNPSKKTTPKKKEKQDCDVSEPIRIAFKPLKSNELPSEIWNCIVTKLDFQNLVKFASLGPADHWLCFYVKHAIAKKKLFIISHALHYLYNYGELVPDIPNGTKTEPGPSSALDLLTCFSQGASLTVLPNLLGNILETHVRYFLRNKRSLTQNHLDICASHPYDKCYVNSKQEFFDISVRIKLINDFPLPWTSYNKKRFSPQDYVIRICQNRNKEKDYFHPTALVLFTFFKYFKFNLEIYDSTGWKSRELPKHSSTLVKHFWPASYSKKSNDGNVQ